MVLEHNTEPFDKVKSWSVGKSYAATAVGLAYDQGYIESTDQSVADFIQNGKELIKKISPFSICFR